EHALRACSTKYTPLGERRRRKQAIVMGIRQTLSEKLVYGLTKGFACSHKTTSVSRRECFMATMREAVIVEAVRTAVGRKNGRLKDWHPVDLMAQVLSALVQRTGVDTNLVEDVIIGCVSQV